MSGTIPPNFDLGFSTGDERWGENTSFQMIQNRLKGFLRTNSTLQPLSNSERRETRLTSTT